MCTVIGNNEWRRERNVADIEKSRCQNTEDEMKSYLPSDKEEK